MKTFASLAAITAALLAGPAAMAQSVEYPDTVLELFTSQGCSSCPPANGFVRNAAQSQDGVLALSYSVEYWDYLGWKDTLGNPAFSARQREYGRQFEGRVYTPQMVLNGAAHSASLRESDLRRYTLPPENALRIVPAETAGYRVTVPAAKPGLSPAKMTPPQMLSVISFTPGIQSVEVKAGENRGRAIRLANVVTDIKTTPLSEGAPKSARIDAPAKGENIALILQSGKGGPIISAAIISGGAP